MQTKTHNSRRPSNTSATPASFKKRKRHRQNPNLKAESEGSSFKHTSRPVRQVSAGGIIYRRQRGKIEILFLKREDGRWTFPKGKRQLGESHIVAAIREIREETGIATLRYVAPLGFTQFKYTERHQGPVMAVAKTVHFFLFEAPPGATFELPGKEGITEAAWIQAERAFATLSYRNMDRLLAKALRLIVEEERKRPNI